MLNNTTINKQRKGFTLVELLVVLALMGLLMTLMFLVVGAVRKSAREASSLGTLKDMSTGLEAVRIEMAEYPPSELKDSLEDGRSLVNAACDRWSAHCQDLGQLLSLTAGGDTAQDTSVSESGGTWEDAQEGSDPSIGDSGSSSRGAEDGGDGDGGDGDGAGGDGDGDGSDEPQAPSGAQLVTWALAEKGLPYVTMEEYRREVLQSEPDSVLGPNVLILDGFGYPILYCKANPGAKCITTAGAFPGIYEQHDNVNFTGDGLDRLGLDLGAGSRHRLHEFFPDGSVVEVHSNPAITDLTEAVYGNTFAQFIWDRKITARNLPVNQDSYLLISPGSDALYGTADDITNWER